MIRVIEKECDARPGRIGCRLERSQRNPVCLSICNVGDIEKTIGIEMVRHGINVIHNTRICCSRESVGVLDIEVLPDLCDVHSGNQVFNLPGRRNRELQCAITIPNNNCGDRRRDGEPAISSGKRSRIEIEAFREIGSCVNVGDGGILLVKVLCAVAHEVIVGVGIIRKRTVLEFLGVRQSVIIWVICGIAGIKAIESEINFPPVEHSVAIGVDRGICDVNVDINCVVGEMCRVGCEDAA